jgi:enoyl-CoA hydratase/carnithine racemase
LFTGRLLDSAEALSCGLIDRLVTAVELDEVASDYAAKISAASVYSIRAQKQILAMLRGGCDDAEASRALFGASFTGADFKEGFAAFMEKRPAQFTVR